MPALAKTTMERALSQMDAWFHSPIGERLLDAERNELNKFLPQYFGGYLLQVGGPSDLEFFAASPIIHRVRLSPEAESKFPGPSVQGDFSHWPFLPESLDVVVLPHVLEFVDDLEEILQQVYFSLAPGGHLILLGFNPLSLWGLEKFLSSKEKMRMPWCGTFHRPNKVVRLLKQLGFVIERRRSFYFNPSSLVQKTKASIVFDVLGKSFWPNCGAVYLVVAEKRVTSLIGLAKHVKKKRQVVRGYLEPTARVRF